VTGQVHAVASTGALPLLETTQLNNRQINVTNKVAKGGHIITNCNGIKGTALK